MSKVKILWVQDENNGPVNGLAEYNGEKLWFSRTTDPLLVSPAADRVPVIDKPKKKEEDVTEDNTDKVEEKDLQEKDLEDSSSDDWEIPDDEDNTSPPEYSFKLYRLSDDDLKLVTDNHIKYCEMTGYPLNHGDPFTVIPQGKVVKMEQEQIAAMIPKDKDYLEVTHQSLGNVRGYKHKINPGDITGDLVVTINQSDFSNYFIPHTIK